MIRFRKEAPKDTAGRSRWSIRSLRDELEEALLIIGDVIASADIDSLLGWLSTHILKSWYRRQMRKGPKSAKTARVRILSSS